MKHLKVVAAIIVKDAHILATQRGYGAMKDGWELPGGKIEEGETPEDALRREIREELKTEVAVGPLFRTIEHRYEAVAEGPRKREAFSISLHCYFCRITGSAPTFVEHEAARWLCREELLDVNWLPADVQLMRDLQRAEWPDTFQ